MFVRDQVLLDTHEKEQTEAARGSIQLDIASHAAMLVGSSSSGA